MILSARYSDALSYAFHLHGEQERKGSGVPYVAHILGVSSLALEYGANEDEGIAALLHDAGEDQGGQTIVDEIRKRFGERVADIVAGCSDTLETPKPPWRERKEQYIRHLASASSSIRLVSGCDKLYNARCILADYRRVGSDLWGRFTGGRDGTLWYYRALANVLTSLDCIVARELEETVATLEATTDHNHQS
jgi:(p)ppGpp synthase/HD superfamily hydrolase